MHDVRTRLMLAAAAVLLPAAVAPALINANFTPVDLVEGADLILILKLGLGADGAVKVEVKRALVGKAPAKPPIFDITSGAKKAHLEMIKKIIAGLGDAPAVMVVGVDEQGEDMAWVHLRGKWVDLYTEDKKTFEAEQIKARMEGTWAGSTDMLIRCIEYIQAADEPDVPVRTGAEWAGKIEVAKLGGKVASASAVDLSGDGKLTLYVASAGGDRLFAYDKGKEAFKDVTASTGLTAKSVVSAWADFNADGKLDLASWDGKALTLHLRAAAGAFAAGKPIPFKGGCVGLAALDVGAKGRPGLLVSTAGAPQLLTPAPGGKFKAAALDMGKVDAKKLGKAGACLVGDLDGDAVADVLQMFAKGGLFYKASAPGKFAAAAATPVGLGPRPSGACLGDWACDGRLDVFAAASDGCRLWHNLGGMKFRELLGWSGEIAYISQPFGFAGQVCDVNNDGRPDVLITYTSRSPHIFFNRGFRSFGHSHQLDLDEKGLLPGATRGLQAACVADLTGDGVQDLAVVTPEGQLVVFPQEAVDEAACVRAALPLGGPHAGPITVTGYSGKRCLGAWNVSAGTAEAFFGHDDVKQITLKWTFPGGKEQTKIVKVAGKPVRVIVKPK